MKRYFGGGALMALLMTFGLMACDEGVSTPRAGTVTVQLTDAPGDEVVKAWVTITEIYLQGGSGESDPPGGRVYLLEDADEAHELLSLANSVETLVADREVPTGIYGQLRIVLSGGCIETAGGAVYASGGYDRCGPATGVLMMPSIQQTGVKVNLHGFEVTSGQNIVLLDFDVSESFGRQAGNSGMWVMSPVIHAANLELSSGVEVTLSRGDVELPEGFALSGFSATLLPETGDTSRVALTDPDEDGVFGAWFRYLIPDNGPFQVRLNAPDGLVVTVEPASPTAVTVTSGENSGVAWVLQSAELDDEG